MPWDTGAWDLGAWDQPADPVGDYFKRKSKPKHNNMKRQDFYPSRIGDQVIWLGRYAAKLIIYGASCGLSAGEIAASVNDALWCQHVLGSWLSGVRSFSPSTTDAVDDVLTGEGTEVMVLPGFVAPGLPDGVTPALPGALNRIFALIAKMKLSPACTEAVATDMGITGPEDTGKALPKFLAELLQGTGCQSVKLGFFKYGHQGVYIESRRGAPDAPFAFLAIDTESPYMDERPLLVAGQPEVREYRMRFWDKGTPNGDWTDVMKVTVSP